MTRFARLLYTRPISTFTSPSKLKPLSQISYQTHPVIMATSRSFASSSQASAKEDWSSKQYLKFHAERTRPARELLDRVPLSSPSRIVDIGCGPGNSTGVIAERYPDANLSGMDSSPDMIKKARETLPNLSFEVADLETYEAEGPVDLFYSNAMFQWIPGAKRIPIITRLVERLSPGGALAFQVPVNTAEPSHVSMKDAAFADDAPWRETLKAAAPARDEFPTAVELYDALQPLCSEVDVWKTTYYHVMEDHQAIVEWVKATGLRPFLDPLSKDEREAYLAKYLALLKERYPSQKDGKVLLPFPRLFLVAVKA